MPDATPVTTPAPNTLSTTTAPNTPAPLALTLTDDQRVDVHTEADRLAKAEAFIANMRANSFPTDMPIDNVHKLLRSALQAAGVEVWTIHTFTQDVVVYERWDSTKIFQRTFSIAADGVSVTLGKDEVEVNIMTKIVAKPDVVVNQNAKDSIMDPTKEIKTSAELAVQGSPPAETSAKQAAEGAPTQSTEPKAQAGQIQATPITPTAPAKPLSVNEYIAQAPEEMRDMLSAGMRMHEQKKSSLVSLLVANENCDYGEAELKTMKLGDLEKLAKLAQISTNYSGQAPAIQPKSEPKAEEAFTPMSVEAFPRKKPGDKAA